jgi:thioredoxin reductase
MTRAELTIVGAGPAGLSAALEAGKAGAEVLLIDENEHLGGQYYRQPTFGARRGLTRARADAGGILEAVTSLPNVQILPQTTVWGIFDRTSVAVSGPDGVRDIEAKALIITTGSFDRAVPLPGWTLPGVFSAGGALTLLKYQHVVPGRKVLLAGAGPLQRSLASQLLDAGCTIVAWLDAASASLWLRQVPKLVGESRLLWQSLRTIFRAWTLGTQLLPRHTVSRIEGDDQVKHAWITRVDSEWRPIPGSERRFDVDAVVFGFGLVPSIELTCLAGCEHHYVASRGGWIPRHSDRMETTVPGVFVAGEVAGSAGAAIAAEQGRVAGIAAASFLGHLSEAEARRRATPIHKRLRKLRRARSGLDELSALREGLLQLITPDTIVCRCEEITAAAIHDTIADGSGSLRTVKARTRAGMGHCQGRLCSPTIAAIIARERGIAVEQTGLPSIRPPVKPIPLTDLL